MAAFMTIMLWIVLIAVYGYLYDPATKVEAVITLIAGPLLLFPFLVFAGLEHRRRSKNLKDKENINDHHN